MSDLIRRSDAIETVKKQFLQSLDIPICKEIRQAFVDAITAIPSAEAVPLCDDCTRCTVKALNRPSAEAEWIPVSEKLPNEDARYLVQMSYGIMQVLSWANVLEKVDDFDFYNEKHSGWYEYDSEWGYCERHEVIAWMPLPKPYREGGEE